MKKLLFYLLFIPVIAVSCEEKIDSNYAPLLGKWYYGTDEAETNPETSTIEFTEKYQIIIRDEKGKRRIGMVSSQYGYHYFSADYQDGTDEFWEVREISDNDLHLILDSGTHFYCTRISR